MTRPTASLTLASSGVLSRGGPTQRDVQLAIASSEERTVGHCIIWSVTWQTLLAHKRNKACSRHLVRIMPGWCRPGSSGTGAGCAAGRRRSAGRPATAAGTRCRKSPPASGTGTAGTPRRLPHRKQGSWGGETVDRLEIYPETAVVHTGHHPLVNVNLKCVQPYQALGNSSPGHSICCASCKVTATSAHKRPPQQAV